MKQTQFFYRDPSAPTPNRPNHIGVSVLIEWQDKLLMEARVDSDVWAIIGGGLQTDESLTDCALREVMEETGITLSTDQLEFIKVYDDPSRIAAYPDGNVLRVITVVYRVCLEQEPTLHCSEESKELRFFSKEDLRDLPIANTHIPIMEDYLA